MNNSARPLSPHLFIYRWPVTMVLSILHRVSGVAMSAGLLMLAAWLGSAAGGPASLARFNEFAAGWLGRLVLIAISFAFFFHLSNGIRHLFWDAGYGFEKRQANASAWAVIGATVVLTLLYWWLL